MRCLPRGEVDDRTARVQEGSGGRLIYRFVLWLLHFIPHYTIYRSAGVPYLTRYYLLGGPRTQNNPDGTPLTRMQRLRNRLPWNPFLHCFHSSDEPIPHNHPWAGISIILRGSYLEWRPSEFHPELGLCDGRALRPGDVNRLEADTFHWVELQTPEVWTLFFAGPRMQEWGFQTSEGFVEWREYKKRRPGATWSSDRSAA